MQASRPLAAITLLESVCEKIREHDAKGLVLYNIGCLYRSTMGDGVNARKYLLGACEELALIADSNAARNIRPNALENLMILSLSYDEYAAHANELRRLKPAADILRGQLPLIEKSREEGHAWFEVMDDIAHTYYDRGNAQRDAGLYGEGAAVFQLLLVNRKALRVNREGWRRALLEYGNLCLRLGADTSLRAEKQNPAANPQESVPIVGAALLFVDEYVAANQNDKDAVFLRDSMRKWVKGLSEAEPPPPFALNAGGDAGEAPPMRMHVVLFKSIVAAVAAYYATGWIFASAPVWVAVVDALVASTVVFWLAAFAETIRSMSGAPAVHKSAALRRQEKIDRMIGLRRPSVVFCSNGHRMEPFESEGVLLAMCPACGIVKPYPGTMALMSDIERVAGKFDHFEF